MILKRLPLVALMATALAVSAPAWALSGNSLTAVLTAKAFTASKGKDAKRTCQAGRDVRKGSAKVTVTDRHSALVVACEQPPRSEIVLPSLKQSATSALTILG
jgi:hypothetical protein